MSCLAVAGVRISPCNCGSLGRGKESPLRCMVQLQLPPGLLLLVHVAVAIAVAVPCSAAGGGSGGQQVCGPPHGWAHGCSCTTWPVAACCMVAVPTGRPSPAAEAPSCAPALAGSGCPQLRQQVGCTALTVSVDAGTSGARNHKPPGETGALAGKDPPSDRLAVSTPRRTPGYAPVEVPVLHTVVPVLHTVYPSQGMLPPPTPCPVLLLPGPRTGQPRVAPAMPERHATCPQLQLPWRVSASTSAGASPGSVAGVVWKRPSPWLL